MGYRIIGLAVDSRTFPFTFAITPRLYYRLKVTAESSGVSVASFLRSMLNDCLDPVAGEDAYREEEVKRYGHGGTRLNKEAMPRPTKADALFANRAAPAAAASSQDIDPEAAAFFATQPTEWPEDVPFDPENLPDDARLHKAWRLRCAKEAKAEKP